MKAFISCILLINAIFIYAQFQSVSGVRDLLGYSRKADLKKITDNLEPYKYSTPEYFVMKCEYLHRSDYSNVDVDSEYWFHPKDDSLIIAPSDDGTVCVTAAMTDTIETYDYEKDYWVEYIMYNNETVEFRPANIYKSLAAIDSGIAVFPGYFILWEEKIKLLEDFKDYLSYLNEFIGTSYEPALRAHLPGCVFSYMDYAETLISMYQQHLSTPGGLIMPENLDCEDSDDYLRKYVFGKINSLSMNGCKYLEERKSLALYFYDKIPDKSVEILMDAANPLYSSGNYTSALELFLILHTLQPEDDNIAKTIKDCYVKAEDYEGVINFIVQESGGDLVNPQLLYDIGYYYILAGNHSEAKKYFKRALELAPKSCEIRIELIKCFMAEKDCSSALELYSWMTENCSVIDRLFAASELEPCGIVPVISGQ